MNILPSLRETIAAESKRLNLPTWNCKAEVFPAFLWWEGLMYHESAGGNPNAYHADVPNPDGTSEPDASYGLMQVEGRTVNLLEGLGGDLHRPFEFLFLPLTNLAFGLRVLTGNLETYAGDVDRTLAAYNGGNRGAKVVEGRLNNQVYVDKVFVATLKVRSML